MLQTCILCVLGRWLRVNRFWNTCSFISVDVHVFSNNNNNYNNNILYFKKVILWSVKTDLPQGPLVIRL